MVAPLHTVLVRRPDAAFGNADPDRWHYQRRPNLAQAQREHDAFVRLLTEAGCEVVYQDQPLPEHADAIYTHDPSLVTSRGAILLRMGKALRQGEEAAHGESYRRLGVPVYYQLSGAALAEGGDLLWLDERTLAVGLGFRTNAEGVRQLQDALPEVTILPFHLAYDQGPEACLHLMSVISLVDHDLAVVYRPLLPVPLYQWLQERAFRLVDVPGAELATMGPNVLALAPGRCLMLDGNPVTRRRLEAAGCQVQCYQGDEVSLNGEGGPTCLTRPILRA
jgi:N-dimethylarginine dimethylaminohydrolase